MDYFISLGYAQICIQLHQNIGAIWNPFWCTWLWSLPTRNVLKSQSPLLMLWDNSQNLRAALCFANSACPLPAGIVNTQSSPLGWLVFKSCGMWSKNTTLSFKKENPAVRVIYIIRSQTESTEENRSLTPLIKMAAFSSSGALRLRATPGRCCTFCWFILT